MNQELCKEQSMAEPVASAINLSIKEVDRKNSELFVSAEAQREQLLNYGTFEYDGAKKTLSCSPGVYHLLGMPLGAAGNGGDDAFLMHQLSEADQKLFWNLLRKDAAHKERFEQSFKIKSTTQGTPQILKVSGVHMQPHTEEHKVIGLMVNITGEKQLEENTRMHILELERSNNDLEGFAYVASHDLQEPLRKIVTFADMLLSRQGQFGGMEKDYLVRIHKSAHDMRALIDNLLEYSHIGQLDAPASRLSLNFILQQSISDLEVKINAVSPHMEIGTLPELCVNPERMRRVFTNLIGNALKFGKKDQPLSILIYASPASEAELENFHLDKTRDYTRITVEDNGIGFEKEYEHRIFQIFQRLHGRSSYPGSGLGLAICKKIIEQHEGYIYAEGEKGKGARFHILLPLMER